MYVHIKVAFAKELRSRRRLLTSIIISSFLTYINIVVDVNLNIVFRVADRSRSSRTVTNV